MREEGWSKPVSSYNLALAVGEKWHSLALSSLMGGKGLGSSIWRPKAASSASSSSWNGDQMLRGAARELKNEIKRAK